MKANFKTNEDLRKLCFKILAEEIGRTADDLIQEVIKNERERLIHEIATIFNRYNVQKYADYHSIPHEEYEKLINNNRWRTKKEIQEETLEELELE